ncbi:MAG: SDR family oxidoreductase [Clostridiales bacterium]|jgi:gluconate 5-dehydrogenase|nr:SDR family oxidoreductase [Clostridia bacterium]MBR5977178.1 SDR family oxidoreductase [Clostridia bacterium]MBR6479651.1 SDR family oxidoreductase [Clostridia bacterium]MBR6512530.1 SDR family oxidoreductase [Clostridia bacterium]MCR4747180.1 SDR family oxidoreductase [Clostridiales bacterium]
MFDYKGKVVAITGASSGLGKQMAEGYAQCGANLVLMARRVERLEASAKEWSEKYGIEVLPVACDVTSTDSINAAVAAADAKFGHVEVIVNCAGGEKGTGTPLVDFDKGDWEFTLNLDLTSVFEVTKVFTGYMKKNIEAGKQTYGRVINIASIYGLVGNTAIPTIAYHASKGAVVNFTRGAAAELAKCGITVNAICPGYFYTELTTETLDTEYFQNFAKQSVPMARYGQGGELNPAAVFLGAEESSYVTGQIIAVDGGYSCI